MQRGFKVSELGVVGGQGFKTSEGYQIEDKGHEWLVSWKQTIVYRTSSGHVTASIVDVCMPVDPADVVFTVIGPVGARP